MEAAELGPSLLAAFACVPDVRSRHGRRFPLPALLTLAAVCNVVLGLQYGHAQANCAATISAYAWSPSVQMFSLLVLPAP